MVSACCSARRFSKAGMDESVTGIALYSPSLAQDCAEVYTWWTACLIALQGFQSL
ncbi:hypothetical protein MBOU_17000 [Mycobacterium bourgelatii]|uniref:Uncharacterized protein n=1 Tax=Mycobacterium bourgelatii TaxID=1273442 RepID=A0A7I9YM08_MYCBU|nr:hypothetical protein MBOU_17000 [Mycobacterium bourgelatii]